jgi:hypothetical protein
MTKLTSTLTSMSPHHTCSLVAPASAAAAAGVWKLCFWWRAMDWENRLVDASKRLLARQRMVAKHPKRQAPQFGGK